MTTKPILLDRHLNSLRFSWSLSQILTINLWLLISLGGFFPLFISIPTSAESAPTITEQLPPPPPISPRSRNRALGTRRYHRQPRTTIEPPTNSSNQDPREYTFSAPNNNSSFFNATRSYRVEVFGASDTLLNQVRSIEPQAFRKNGVIQAGIFQDQANAEELVRKLTIQGLWSRIISND